MRSYQEEEAIENRLQGDENRFEEEENAETVYSIEEVNAIYERFRNMIFREDKPHVEPWPQEATQEQGTPSPQAHSSQDGENIDWKFAPITSRHPLLSNEDQVSISSFSQHQTLEDHQAPHPSRSMQEDQEEEHKEEKINCQREEYLLEEPNGPESRWNFFKRKWWVF